MTLTNLCKPKLKKYIKRDSYFKIKSGWLGTKEEIDSSLFGDNKVKAEEAQTAEFITKQKALEADRKAHFLKYRKTKIHQLETNNFLNEDNELDVFEKSRRYEFECFLKTELEVL